MTTTQFDFLKNFNPEAYEIALQIEDEVTTSPASIKTYATTFLECIVDDMLLKSGNKNNVKPTANFTPKVKKLSMFDVIKYSFETQLINAYKLRNTAHYSLKKTAEEDRRLALELHEKLFHIAGDISMSLEEMSIIILESQNMYRHLGKMMKRS